jgi:hypothetical protein
MHQTMRTCHCMHLTPVAHGTTHTCRARHSARAQVVTLFVGSLGSAQLAAHSGILNVFSVLTCGM